MGNTSNGLILIGIAVLVWIFIGMNAFTLGLGVAGIAVLLGIVDLENTQFDYGLIVKLVLVIVIVVIALFVLDAFIFGMAGA